MSKIILNKSDIEEITRVIKDHDIQHFKLVYKPNAIGYIIDIQYSTKIHGKMCTVKVPITGVETW